jgi:hypothetical protein
MLLASKGSEGGWERGSALSDLLRHPPRHPSQKNKQLSKTA